MTTTLCCVADEPPSWSPYKKISKSNNFFCWIDYADRDTQKFPWERKWKLKIFKKDSTLIWQRDFQPSGYTNGILSNDGNSFIIIEYWYSEKGSVVEVFNRNLKDYFIKGEEFKISTIFLNTTVSHQLWLENYKYEGDKILIKTNDKNIWEIDLVNRKLKAT